MALELRSSAFPEDGTIAKKYTCDGLDVSVPLSWRNPPEGTKSFALIMDDPDAPSATWVHWVLYDLAAETRQLAEGLPPKEVLDDGAKQGLNDFQRIGYGGPCPPRGPAHRYCFKLFALNRMTGLPSGATKPQLLRAMKGHILGQTQLTATYGRK
jgi:Raf kinase inhibitor-like YbhB/YbcL family protein